MKDRRLTCPGTLRGRVPLGRPEKCRSAEVVVTVRRGNFSKFHGGRFSPSEYSEVRCLACGRFWRTKSTLVDLTRDARGDEAHRVIP